MTSAAETREPHPLTALSAPAFTPPGPGFWEQDPAHWPRPVTPWTAAVFPRPFARGFMYGTARYGVLLDHFSAAVIGGYVYYRVVPALDHEVPARLEAARRALEARVWREDLASWDQEFKPDSIRRHRRLQAVDVAALGDLELAAYLAECRENQEEMVYRHHRFTIPALVPVGLFASQAAAWTGLERSTILDLLRGSSPATHGIGAGELRAVGRELKREGLGPDSFPGLAPSCVIERLAGRSGPLGEAVRAYLETSGLQLVSGYDVAERTLGELPDMLLRSLWSARELPEPSAAAPHPAAIERVRAAVPDAHRAEFDQLFAEAWTLYRLRDERGLFNDLWAAGISRRAIQEAGRRLALRGRIDEAELVFEAAPEEMFALLGSDSGPDSEELERRAVWRRTARLEDIPPTLGGAPPPAPSLEGLPPDARRVAEAIEFAVAEILGGPPQRHEGRALRGKGVSRGTYAGPARVVLTPADFNRVEKGDVLVTPSTNAAFNVLLPLIGAVVTDRGALLSHAAIVAREYGLPAVVATGSATNSIRDGARVRVDGAQGTVEVLS